LVKDETKQDINELWLAQFKKGHPMVYKTMLEHAHLHEAKNADYASPEQPLANFERVGKWIVEYELWRLAETNPALFTAIVYMLKQLDAAFKLLGRNEKGGVEGVPQRFDDVSVYSVISKVLYIEGK